MKDHFVKNRTLTKCRLCGNELEEKPWQSCWELNQHYKVNTCDKCGKKTWVKVNFLGSGDDDWKPKGEE